MLHRALNPNGTVDSNFHSFPSLRKRCNIAHGFYSHSTTPRRTLYHSRLIIELNSRVINIDGIQQRAERVAAGRGKRATPRDMSGNDTFTRAGHPALIEFMYHFISRFRFSCQSPINLSALIIISVSYGRTNGPIKATGEANTERGKEKRARRGDWMGIKRQGEGGERRTREKAREGARGKQPEANVRINANQE